MRSAAFAVILFPHACSSHRNVDLPARRQPVELHETPIVALMDSGGIPGLALSLITPDTIVTRGFGSTGSEVRRAVDENTVFEAASLSKPVIAYTTLRLVDRGLLSLDRPLVEYLPYPDLGDDPRGRLITARMVLSHTTGLQNERSGSQALQIQFAPGTAFRYSGEGYEFLGKVIEKLVALPLNEVVTREVFAPLGMTRSSFVWNGAFADNAAVGHGRYLEARRPNRNTIPFARGSLHTSARDYALFLQAVMNGRGISSGAREQLLERQVHVTDSVDWGLGWGLEHTAGRTFVWHHGDNSGSGFTAFVMWLPKDKRGVVYFANRTTGLGITARLLQIIAAPFDVNHPALPGLRYEQYNAPGRMARLAVEKTIREEGVAAGLRLYAALKRGSSSGVFSENLLNDLGYRFVSLGRLDDAIELFKRNVQEYPSSSNVYDSLGEAYATAGKRELALQNYRESVRLDPRNAHAAEMVRKLEQNQR